MEGYLSRCVAPSREEGKGHGDLHGLQHLFHGLHGAFVLLGPTASQLHDRGGGTEKRRTSDQFVLDFKSHLWL
ncbi:unnamed protein product [Lampetra planeri]